jgi:hypothetical protein
MTLKVRLRRWWKWMRGYGRVMNVSRCLRDTEYKICSVGSRAADSEVLRYHRRFMRVRKALNKVQYMTRDDRRVWEKV